MYDPQYQEFQGRLRRVDRIHRRGGGFEAVGTLGRSFYNQRTQRRPLLRVLMVVAAGFLAIKALLLMQIGTVDYQDRLQRLHDGSMVEQAGAYVMQIDPVTAWLSVKFHEILKNPV